LDSALQQGPSVLGPAGQQDPTLVEKIFNQPKPKLK